MNDPRRTVVVLSTLAALAAAPTAAFAGQGHHPDPSPQRVVACYEAANLPPGWYEEHPPQKLHGLDNAIYHVVTNCLWSTGAGPLKAVQRLSANQAKHAD